IEVRVEVQLLENDPDARMRGLPCGLEGYRRTVEKQPARSGLFHAGKNFHQRRLAGSILAYENVDGAAIDGEIHLIERYGSREALGDLLGDHNDSMPFRPVLLHLIRRLHGGDHLKVDFDWRNEDWRLRMGIKGERAEECDGFAGY